MLQLVGQRSLFSNVRTLLLPVSLIRPYQYLPYCCHSVDFGTWTAILCTFLTLPSKKAPEKEPNDIAPLLSNKHDTLFQNSLSSRTKNSFAVVVNIYLAFFHIKSGNICDLQQYEQGDNDNLQFSLRVLGFIGLCSATSVSVLGSPRLT